MMNKIIVTIPAGGRGERLRPITDYIPKPMIPFGNNEKPVLEHIIEWIKKFRINDFVLLVGYKHRQIMNYFRDGDRWGINIKYSIDDAKYKGTGGSLLKAYLNGLFEKFDYVLVWYGDIVADVNIWDLINLHKEKEAEFTIVAVKNYRLPVGLIEVKNDNKIIKVEEKPILNKFVGIGIILFSYNVLSYLKELNKTTFDLAKDFIPFLLRKNIKGYIYQHNGWWIDVGEGLKHYYRG